MYAAEQDPDCYPGTTVLRNRLDLTTQTELDAFEAEITAQRAAEPLPAGAFDAAHYRAIHRHLFQDVYDWAGQYRRVRIAKGGNWFCYPENIDAAMQALFSGLQQRSLLAGLAADAFASQAAHFFAELNAIHSFREGNGRTQLSFLLLAAENAGHPLDLQQLDPDAMLRAIITSFGGDERPLMRVIGNLIA